MSKSLILLGTTAIVRASQVDPHIAVIRVYE